MNARSHTFEIAVEERQIEEVVASLFHALLFHRTLGKFHYKQEGSYSIGSVGMTDVDCDFIDFTYVRTTSDELDRLLKKEIRAFRDDLRATENSNGGQIAIEFYQKKRVRWPFPAECIPWEVWNVKVNIVSLSNEHEHRIYREKVGEMLSEKMMYIVEAMSRHEYMPKIPNQSDLELVFDVTLTDVQPYLFKISYQTDMASSASVGTTMRRFFKDTLAL